ncbi:hypothetical protein Tco_0054156 [Tanacetum coccineum]
MPQEGLAIIESKSKSRYARKSCPNDSRVSTDAPLSNSSSSNNSFDMQQIAASLEDKMTIKMNQMMSQMKALVVTPAPVKAVEEVCVTCGSNHNFNHCPLTRGGNDFPVFQDNIQQFQQTAAVGNFLQRNQPSNLASQMRPPVRISGEEDSIFIEIPKPKAKETVSLDPNSYPSKLPYPERMKVREHDKPSAQHSRFLKMFKQLRLEIGLKDALVEMPKFNKCSREARRSGKISYPMCFTKENSIGLNLSLKLLTPTSMTLELANRSISHPMGIAEDVVVRVDDDPFSGSTTTHSDDPSPSSSPVKTSDNFVKFADELAPLDSLPPGNDDSTLKKDLHEENFQEDEIVTFLALIQNPTLKSSGSPTLPGSQSRYGYVKYCKKSVKKRTRERMSDQEAKEIKAEAREIMPQPSTVNQSPSSIVL